MCMFEPPLADTPTPRYANTPLRRYAVTPLRRYAVTFPPFRKQKVKRDLLADVSLRGYANADTP